MQVEVLDAAITIDLLVQLKLAGRRHRNFGDVVEWIRFNNLNESFATKLHRDYLEMP